MVATALHQPSTLAYWSQVNNELVLTVEANQLVHGLLIVGGNGTRPRLDSLTGKVEILAEMTGIKEDHPVCGEPITPFTPIRNAGPDKRHRRATDK